MNNIGTFSLDKLAQTEFNKITAFINPKAIKKFCHENEIIKFTICIIELMYYYIFR